MPICKFCNKSAKHSPLTEMNQHKIEVYFCHTCSAEYLFWASGNPLSLSLYKTLKDKMYRWTFSFGTIPENNVGRLWYIKTPGIPGTRKNENLQHLKAFYQDIPDITPNNFEEKLKIYLLFL